jgi:predicted ATPase
VAGGKALPAEVVEQLVDRTDGVPLYVEEMTKAVLESGVLKEINDHYELVSSLSSLTVPATLQDSLMARLDRLMTAKVIAQLGGTIGRQFSYELLKEVAQFDEGTLQRELTRLVEAELLSQRGLPPHATYIFKHALIQATAYESLLRSTRQGYHRRIAEVLIERFPETAETQPELLAHHYTEAGLHEQAIGYWQQAGAYAKRRSAHVEAINHITKGLEILARLPETPESLQHELMLQTALGPPLLATKGYASSEVGQVYTRARALCQQVGEAPQLIQVLLGLWMFYIVRAELQTASDLGEQLLQVSQRQHDPELQLEAYEALGITASMRGALTVAHTHFEQCMALYDPQKHRDHAVLYGQDSQVAFLCHTSLVLWLLGYPDQARQQCHHALTLATDLSHAFSVSWALLYCAMVQAFCRCDQGAHEQAEALIILCREQGFAYRLMQGRLLRNWVRAEHGKGKEAIEQICRDVLAISVTGAEVYRPYYLSLLAQAYAYVEQIEDGLNTLDEALTLVEKHDERWCEAELHRLQGQLLLQQSPDNATEAETYFHQAIAIAQNQSAKSWELRAATSLAQLWHSQGKRQEAYDLLAPVYSWFTEGFDTADLKDAKALLNELAKETPREAR